MAGKSDNAHQDLHIEVADTIATHEVAHSSPTGQLFNGNVVMLASTWVTFFLLLFVLGKYAWKPILKTIEDRENRIADSLKQAEKIEQSLDQAKQQQEQILQKARDEAKAIVDNAHKEAVASAQAVTDAAREQADRSISRAQEEIAGEREKALQAIRSEVATMVVSASEKLIRTNLDEQKNKKIVEHILEELH